MGTEEQNIESLIATTKKQAEEIQAYFDKVNKLVAVIEDYYTKFDEIRSKIDIDKTNIQTKSTEVDQLRNSAQTNLQQIKDDLSTVKNSIDQINAEYQRFLTIKEQVNNGETGLEATLKKSQSISNDVATLKQSSENNLGNIQENLNSIAEKVKEMNLYYDDTFTQTKVKVENDQTGLNAILDNATTLQKEIEATKKQADSLYNEIKKFRDDSQDFYKKIEKINTDSENSLGKIKEYENTSSDYKDKIGLIYKLATDSSLANSFDSRKKELEKSQRKWFWVLMVSTFLLAVGVFIVLLPVLRGDLSKITGYTWYRLTMTSPLLFLVGFASTQYSKERNLLERYAFKSATALALESYTSLLMNTFDKEKNEDKILEFVLESMSMIYQEPYEHLKESKFSVGFDGKIANIKAELSNTLESKIKSMLKNNKDTPTATS